MFKSGGLRQGVGGCSFFLTEVSREVIGRDEIFVAM